jgi:hypothetical protein
MNEIKLLINEINNKFELFNIKCNDFYENLINKTEHNIKTCNIIINNNNKVWNEI